MYGDFMMMVDAMVGRVIATLESRDLLEDTLLVFTSDNGPYWRSEDVERFDHDSAGGFRGMKGDAWEAGHRVPFIVRWPGKVAPGSTSGQLIGFTDLLATFAALTSAEVPAGDAPDSVSFLPVLLGDQPEDKPVREAWAMQAGSGAMLYRAGHWKLIDALGSGGFSQPRREDPVPGGPTGQLYDLANDPAETTNLYLEHPDIVARLTAELARVKEGQAE
jgi:arylsulfatase A-like enzyme